MNEDRRGSNSNRQDKTAGNLVERSVDVFETIVIETIDSLMNNILKWQF